MFHALHGDLLGSDIDLDWVVLIFLDQSGNIIIQSRTEQDGLPVLGTIIQNMTYRINESHVSHTVGLIQDHRPDVIQLDGLILHQVDQSAWRGHYDVNPFLQPRSLFTIRHSSVDRHYSQPDLLGQRFQDLADLLCQFPGGCNDQSRRIVWMSWFTV